MKRVSDRLQHSAPKNLGLLLGLEDNAERVWRPEELAAIFRHQMSTSVQYDLRHLPLGKAGRLKALAEAEGLLLKSFSDLLQHPHPPVDLLNMTKEFAKACQASPDSPLPREIATAVYYATIVVARLRCGVRISRLTDADLRKGVEWAVAQPWLDDPTRALFQEALEMLPANCANGRE